jgi:exonuclease VII small subunit
MSVDELDAMLEDIRERRLERVHKLEAIAKIKSDDAQLTSWLAFERAYKVTKRAVDKLIEQEKRVDQLIHKLRLKAMVVQLEVREEEAA